MRSERQALAGITDLVADARSRGWVTTRKLDAILADVHPEPAPFHNIDGWCDDCEHGTGDCKPLPGEPGPAPVGGTIDRDALEEAWDQGNASGLDGWIGPGRGAGEVDPEAIAARARDVDHILARVRPVEGVVLTPDQQGKVHVEDGWRIRRTYVVGQPGELVERLEVMS